MSLGYHRRSNRLQGYDYSLPGVYFVTIVTFERGLYFGEIIQGEMHSQDMGQIAKDCWLAIPEHFPNVEVYPFVVMPNHVHGVITISDDPGRGTIYRAPTEDCENFGHPVVGSLPTIVRTFKAAASRCTHNINTISHVW